MQDRGVEIENQQQIIRFVNGAKNVNSKFTNNPGDNRILEIQAKVGNYLDKDYNDRDLYNNLIKNHFKEEFPK